MTADRPGTVPASTETIESLLRRSAPQALAALVRRHGRFDAAEDAVQEALLAAAQVWPRDGVPERPEGWLVTVATRRLVDTFRSEGARRQREEAAAGAGQARQMAPPVDEASAGDRDDTLTLLFMCCHSALSPPSQVALTLRAVGGLTTAEIARAFLVPEGTMARRITRAKERIRDQGARFEPPAPEEQHERLHAVLHVLYLVFNEGYVTTSGPQAARVDLTAEAIRLTREVRHLRPENGEVAGLLALMLLTDARRPARIDDDGSLVPLAEQDRTRWDRELLEEGTDIITRTLTAAPLGPYQVQAAIAAVHGEAASAADTDWRQIVALYRLLDTMAPSPVVTLNRAVAVAMADGAEAGLALLDDLEEDQRLARSHRLDAVRSHLREMAGDDHGALAGYREAARRATSLPERRYLERQADRLAGTAGGANRD